MSSTKVTYLSQEYRNFNGHASRHQSSFNASFCECFRPVLTLVQLCGLLPIDNQANGFRLRFASLKYLHSLLVATAILTLATLSFIKALHDNLEFDKIVTFIFYFIDFLVVLLFQQLGKNWGDIMIVWTDFERTLDRNEQLLGRRYSLKVTFQLIIIGSTTLSVLAEILGVVAGFEKGAQCVGVQGDIQRYFRQAYPQLFFMHVEYSLWKGILMQIIQFLCTFIRMFLDVFLVYISIGLCRLIERLNLQYGGVPRSSTREDFWERYKHQYLKFINLVDFVDERLGYIVLLCFFSDLYLICIRILNSLKSMGTARQAVFFSYALIFLIMRLVCVCYFASNIHLEAKRPLKVLRKVPTSCWSVEAERFQRLITENDVCLSGFGYFKLRRTLLLSVRILKPYIISSPITTRPTNNSFRSPG